MTHVRILAFALGLICCAPWSAGGADLETAIALYGSALYEEALVELDAAADDSNADLVDQYRALCFLALGRQDDAEAALERIVLRSPSYEVDATTVSPKLVDVFTQIRTRILPVAARLLYADAKEQYDLGRFAEARQGFITLLGILEEARDLGAGEATSDLAQLGTGFLELTEVALARTPEPPPVLTVDAALPPVEPTPGLSGETPDEPVVVMSRVYSAADAGVVPPVALEREVPRWAPRPGEPREARGALEIVVTENGSVESVAIATPTTPAYDRALQAVACDWRFTPAMREGTAVKFRFVVNVVLSPPPSR